MVDKLKKGGEIAVLVFFTPAVITAVFLATCAGLLLSLLVYGLNELKKKSTYVKPVELVYNSVIRIIILNFLR